MTNGQEVSQEVAVYTTKDIDLDVLLGQLGGGIKITVNREEPRWCDGYLDTLTVDGDEPISLETIRDLFGGRKLVIKVVGTDGRIVAKRTVKFPDEPRKDGRALKNPDDKTDDNSETKSIVAMLLENQKNMANMQVQNTEKKDVTAMLIENQKTMADMQAKNSENMLKMAKQHTEAFQRVMSDRLSDLANYQKNNVYTGQNNGDGLNQVLSSIETMEALRERLGGEESSLAAIATPQILGMAEMALERFIDSKTQADKSTPTVVSRPLPDRVSQSGHADEKNNGNDDTTDEEFILSAIKRVKSMPQEKRDTITKLITKEFMDSQQGASDGDPLEDDQAYEDEEDDDFQIDIDSEDA